MTRAIFGRSSSTLASLSIIEAMISTWYEVNPSVYALGDDVLLAQDELHQVDHPLGDVARRFVGRDLIRVGEQQALQRCETFGLSLHR